MHGSKISDPTTLLPLLVGIPTFRSVHKTNHVATDLHGIGPPVKLQWSN